MATIKNWMNQAENRIYTAQEKLIQKRFGKKASEKANYGWSVEGESDVLAVFTKVYGKGILITTMKCPSFHIEHTFQTA